MKKVFCAVVLTAWALPSWAAWFGNPAEPITTKVGAMELVYETGERDIKDSNGAGGTSDVGKRALFVQGRLAMGPVLQIMGRVVPGTGRVSFPGVSFDPKMWGFGMGIRLSPPEKMGPVRLGVLAAWDWTFGASEKPGVLSGSDSVNWAEGTVAGGAAVAVHEMVQIYGGGSLVKPDIHLDLNGVESNLEGDAVFGGFLGAGFRPDEAWNIGVEKHFGNEDTVGLNLSYFF